MKAFEKTEAIPQGTTTTEIPAREASVHADVMVPLLQALLTGMLTSGIFTLAVAEFVPRFPYNLFKLWGIVALLIAAIAWLLLLGQHRRLLWAREEFTNTDIDGDGHIGEPPKRTIQVEVRDDNGQIRKYFDTEYFEIDDDCLLHFARGIVQDWNFTEGRWIRDRKAFPRGVNQYRAFRSKLEDKGYIVKENDADNAVRIPTAYGKSLFKRLAEL